MENNWKKINLIKKLETVNDYYVINQDGIAKSIAYTYTDKNGVVYKKSERELKPNLDRDTTARISLGTKDGRNLNISLGYIVASLFLDNPNNYTSIEYIDGNCYNYKYNNLKWVDAETDPSYDIVESLEGEIWKKIKDFPNYEVSNYGRVKSLPRNSFQSREQYYSVPKKSQLLSPILEERTGYYIIGLSYFDNRSKICTKRIHRLVAETFLPNPNNYPQVDHINHDKSNNTIDNLRWVTARENTLNGGSTKIEVTFPDGHKEILNTVDEVVKVSNYSYKGIIKQCVSETEWKSGEFGFKYAEKSYQSKIAQTSRKEKKNIKREVINQIEKYGYILSETKDNDKVHIKDDNNIFPINIQIKNCSTNPNYFNIKSTIDDDKPFAIYWNKTTVLDEKIEPLIIIDSETFFRFLHMYKLIKNKNPNISLMDF